MRHSVTTKILLVAASAMLCLALVISSQILQRVREEASDIRRDCRAQLLSEIREGRLDAGGRDEIKRGTAETVFLRRLIAVPLPHRARLLSLAVDGAGLGTATIRNDEVSDTQIKENGHEWSDPSYLVGLLSPMPEEAVFTLYATPSSSTTARVDFRASKLHQGREVALELECLCVGMTIFLIGLYYSLNIWISRPASAVVRLSRSVIHGDRTIRLSVQSQDEFGQIIQAYNDLVDEFLTTQHQADTDGLTQLYNHRYLFEKIDEAIAQARLSEHSMAILLIDLDKFKLLNDTYGHLTGDRYLRQTSVLLRRAVHLDGIAGRYGGDEFLIVLPHADARRLAQMEQRVRSLMQQEKFRPHPLADPLPMAFSLGAAIYPDHGNDAQELIAYADAALYEEKSGGFNLIEFTRQLEAEYLKSHPATLVQRQGKGAESGGFGMLFNLVVAVDKRDAYTKRHSEHVAQWAVHLGSFLGMADEDRQILQIAGLLHDVGKIGVPDTILRKPGALTDEEYSIMKGHVVLAKHLIQEIPHQTQVREIVACHHERWDGRGYPEGRCGTEMPLGGRILSIVDAYSAMSLDRPYRSGMALSEICQRLRQGAGTQFDPALVEPLIGLLCDATVGNVPTLSAIPCSRASAERRAA